MLKTKPLNALLAQSLSEHVSSAIVFTPSGNLLASATSPTSADAKKARVHSALAANIWSTYERIAVRGDIEQALPPNQDQPDINSVTATGSNTGSGSKKGEPLQSLTVELTDYNLHIQYVQPGILLGMIGRRQGTGQPSSNSSQHSNEGSENERGTGSTLKPGSQGAGSASGSGSSGGGALGVLKLASQTLTDYLRRELKDFEPPEGL